MSYSIEELYARLKAKHIRLVARYNHLLRSYNLCRVTFKRLRYNYLVVKRNYLVLRRYATNKVTALIDHINNQKYQLVFDEYRAINKISKELLEAIGFTQEDLSASFYVDILFEKYLPQPDRAVPETVIPAFRFPVMIENYPSEGEECYPFMHFSVSGKISFSRTDECYHYYLNIEDVSSEVELEYFQKTDRLINKLSMSNIRLMNAKKTIEMHKRMLISLTCSLIGEYSRETSVHLKKMELLTTCLSQECKRLGLIQVQDYDLEEYVKDISYTSVLHDIGKMAIPSEILEKDDRLNRQELEVVIRHPAIGASYIKKIMDMFSADPQYASYCGFLQIPWEICRYHHERWDGKGYPDGLAGSAIPVAARIVSVVDTYEALRGERVYNHEPKDHQGALDIIQAAAGEQFDPQIVEALLSIGYKFEQVYRDCTAQNAPAATESAPAETELPIDKKMLDEF